MSSVDATSRLWSSRLVRFLPLYHGQVRGRTILILSIPTLAVYLYMILITIPLVSSHAGGMRILDMQPLGYSVEYARELLDGLGEAGRNTYLWRQLPPDLFYPGFYAVTLSLLLSYLLRRTFPSSKAARYLVLLPIAGGFFDYLENLGVGSMLVSYPDVSTTLIRVTGCFTLLKSGFSSLAFLSLIALAVLQITRRGRWRRLDIAGNSGQ